MVSTSSSVKTPIVTGKNYEYSYLTMMALFIGQDIWKIFQLGYTEPKNQTSYKNLTQAEKDVLREQRKKDGKVLFYIHQFMRERILPRVAATVNAK